MKTYSQKPAQVQRSWFLLDASEAPLGRIATKVAKLLLGKEKPAITSHVDGGDYVIIINANNLVLTGEKDKKKIYYRHSGFPGGLYARSLKEQHEKDPAKIIYKAVRGMLPDNKLRRQRLARLKIYPDMTHEHSAQKPQQLSIKENS